MTIETKAALRRTAILLAVVLAAIALCSLPACAGTKRERGSPSWYRQNPYRQYGYEPMYGGHHHHRD